MAELEDKSVKRTVRSSPISDFAGQAREVTGDLLELVELQVKLARLDARDAAERVIRPVVFLLGAICLAIAALPVVFVGLAGWLAHATDLLPWAAQLIVALLVPCLQQLLLGSRSARLLPQLRPLNAQDANCHRTSPG